MPRRSSLNVFFPFFVFLSDRSRPTGSVFFFFFFGLVFCGLGGCLGLVFLVGFFFLGCFFWGGFLGGVFFFFCVCFFCLVLGLFLFFWCWWWFCLFFFVAPPLQSSASRGKYYGLPVSAEMRWAPNLLHLFRQPISLIALTSFSRYRKPAKTFEPSDSRVPL